MAWERLSWEEIPNWIEDVMNEMPKGHAAGCPEFHKIVHGDTFVYKITLNEGGNAGRACVDRQLKSDYFHTNNRKGTCPNCQAYVRRMDRDDYLTCHRCGWQYKSLTARVSNILPF